MDGDNNKLIGNGGEEYAAVFLESNGYTILARGWRVQHLELDIVAHDVVNNILRIVEVKSRVVNCAKISVVDSNCCSSFRKVIRDESCSGERAYIGGKSGVRGVDVDPDFSVRRAMTRRKAERVMKAGRLFAQRSEEFGQCEMALDLITVEFPRCSPLSEVFEDNGFARCEPMINHYTDIHWEFC